MDGTSAMHGTALPTATPPRERPRTFRRLDELLGVASWRTGLPQHGSRCNDPAKNLARGAPRSLSYSAFADAPPDREAPLETQSARAIGAQLPHWRQASRTENVFRQNTSKWLCPSRMKRFPTTFLSNVCGTTPQNVCRLRWGVRDAPLDSARAMRLSRERDLAHFPCIRAIAPAPGAGARRLRRRTARRPPTDPRIAREHTLARATSPSVTSISDRRNRHHA